MQMAGISKNSISTGMLDGLDSLVNAGHIRSTVWTDKLALLILWCICHQISRNGLFIIKSVGLAEQNFLKSI